MGASTATVTAARPRESPGFPRSVTRPVRAGAAASAAVPCRNAVRGRAGWNSGGHGPIRLTSGFSSSSTAVQGQVARLASVCAIDSCMLAARSSGWPCHRGQPAYSGQSLARGLARGAHRGLAPDRKTRSARHSRRTSSSLTLDISPLTAGLSEQGPSAALAAIGASPIAQCQSGDRAGCRSRLPAARHPACAAPACAPLRRPGSTGHGLGHPVTADGGIVQNDAQARPVADG